MKTVAKVFLWITIVVLALYVFLFGMVAFVGIVASIAPSEATGPGLVLAMVFCVATVVLALMLAYNIYFLNRLGKASKKSDLKTWQIVLLFFSSNLVSGILLCCMDDNDFAPEGASAYNKPSPLDTIMKYKLMLDEGLISQEDYEAKKKELLK